MPHLSPHFVDPIFLFLAELSWVNLRFAIGNDLRWARARFLSLVVLQPGHPHRGSEFVSALFCDSFLLDSSSCKWQWRNWNGVHSNFWSALCPLAVCQTPHHSNHTAVGLVVPSALRFQSSAFASPEHTLHSSNEALCNVVSHSKPNTHFVTGIHSVLGPVEICLANTFSPSRTGSCDKLPAMPSLGWHSPVSTFLTPGQHMLPAYSTNHGKIAESSLSFSYVLPSMWHLVVLMKRRSSITVLSMSPLDGLSPERKDCWLRVAIQCDTAHDVPPRRKAPRVQHFFVPDSCLSWMVRLTWPVPVPFLVLPTHSLGPNFRFVRLVIQCLFCVWCDSSFCHRVGLYLCYVCVYVLCVCFCRDVVVVLLSLRVARVCGCRSAKVNITKKQENNMKTTITTKNTANRNCETRNHENLITKKKKKRSQTHTREWRHWENMISRITRKNDMRSTFKWFTDSRNSQRLSHFAAAVIVVRGQDIHLEAIKRKRKILRWWKLVAQLWIWNVWMILPQLHWRKPCDDFSFLSKVRFTKLRKKCCAKLNKWIWTSPLCGIWWTGAWAP